MAYTFLTTRRDGHVEHLTLNRPDVRNAFNEVVVDELTRWAHAIAGDATVRAVVLGGAGRVFCAGADLAWMSKMVGYTREENVHDAEATARMYAALDALPMPLIGRVHGAALGGGAGLAAVCDIVVAGDDTVFGFTEVRLGIIPAVIAPFVLAKIGASAARELFVTGARFGAARAHEIGLVHAVAPAASLDTRVGEYLREIAAGAPGAIAAAKALLRRIAGQSPDAVRTLTAETIAERRASQEGQDGMKAFLEKRKPAWMA